MRFYQTIFTLCATTLLHGALSTAQSVTVSLEIDGTDFSGTFPSITTGPRPVFDGTLCKFVFLIPIAFV